MTATLVLAERLDLPAARPLARDLIANEGEDLAIDAGRVAHLGGLALQLLIAATRRWRAEGLCLTVAPRSVAFDDAVRLFGVAEGDLPDAGDATCP